MEVTPGFKNTDAGVVPDDWTNSLLGELSSCSSGTTPSRALYDRYFRGGTTPWVKTLDLNNGLIAETSECVSEAALKETSLSVYPVGTVLIAMYGGFQQIGRTGLLRVPATVNQALTAVRPNPDRLDSEFLLATLNYRVAYWKSVASSSRKDPNITGNDVRRFPIAFPSPFEQRAIASALNDVDALLAGLDRLIAKKRDLKQAAMQQLLTGKTRLPGFQGAWVTKRLGDIGEISGSGVDKKSRPDEVSVRLLNYMDVYRRSQIYSDFLNHTVTAQPEHARRCNVLKGDVFFTPSSETRDDIAHSAVAMEDIPGAAYSYHLVRLRLRDPWDLRFRAYAFNTTAFFRQAETVCDGGGTRYVISLDKFRGLVVTVPPVAEQAAIAEILWDIDAELSALEARREKTRALKQGMMQELLTGRTRLV